jgi:hypothetical protein
MGRERPQGPGPKADALYPARVPRCDKRTLGLSGWGGERTGALGSQADPCAGRRGCTPGIAGTARVA